MDESRERNRLGDQTSPYLLQHAHNPVHWYPWGEEAIARARAEDRPILLSIGYAACHWCHVMERESFESPETARLMNENFVCIKVDREERPDVDDIYMRAVQMMTGQGGWPLTCFLTPDLRPFYGGTYFPPEDRAGMPSFRRLLVSVAEAYRERRGQVEEMASDLRDHLTARHPAGGAAEILGQDLVHRAAMDLHDRVDPNWGGFGGAPKFPHSTSISLLIRYARQHEDEELLGEALFSLEQMAAGGIRDHLGGGFHRYSTDARWLVPHFEKMLYDNALLASAYLEGYRLTGEERLGEVARTTLDWTLREMQTDEGGYASTLDADSEGGEGRFYVWSRAEIEGLLGAEAELFCDAYGVTATGNWEGTNVLHLPRPVGQVAAAHGLSTPELQGRLAAARATLLEARGTRVRPAQDDKVLADWNGLMIAAMAEGARVLDDARYLESATRAADFVLERMMRGGRLLHTARAGRAHVLAYLDDYAAMLGACVELFLTTFEERWLRHARSLADGMIVLFWDERDGGFFFTGADHEELLTRPRSGHDGATPSGNGLAATWLQRLAAIVDEPRYERHARETLYAFSPQLRRAPSVHAQMMLALDDHLAERREIVVTGSLGEGPGREALRALWRRWAPHDLVIGCDPAASDLESLRALPMVTGKTIEAGAPTFWVCRSYACEAPTRDLASVLGG